MAREHIELDGIDSSRSTLTSRALENLRRAIVEGRLLPGRLYSVAELADSLHVSRTPVREALLLLESQGAVRFERNRGVRVIAPSAQDIREMFELRLLLEVPATQRACGRLTDEELADLHVTLDAMTEFASARDESAFMARDKRFHEVILRASGNERLVVIVGELRDQIRVRGVSTVEARRGDLPSVLEEHVRIKNALDARDPDAAGRAMHEHIVHTADLLLAHEDPINWPPSAMTAVAGVPPGP